MGKLSKIQKRYGINSVKVFLLPLSAVLLSALYPIMFLWGSNANAVSFVDVISPIKMYLGVATLLFFVAFAISRKIFPSALAVVCVTVFFTNYRYIELGLQKIWKGVRYWHALSIVAAIIFVVIFLLFFKIKESSSKIVLKISAVVFSALIIINLVSIIPSAIKTMQYKSTSSEPNVSLSSGKRNVYFLLFDEYSSNEFMKKHYNYDNANFTNTLEEWGFSVNYSGVNEISVTSVVTTNLFNLDYVVQYDLNRNLHEIDEKRKNNRTFELFRENDYSVNIIAGADFYGFPLLDAATTIQRAVTASGEDFTAVLLKNTPFHIFNRINIRESAKEIMDGISYLQTPENFEDGSHFTLAHFLLPHPPFIFDRHGNSVRGYDTNNWDNKKYYLEQYIYSTSLMLEITKSILENDSDSVVVLISDHSARSSTRATGSLFPETDKIMFFSAVYVGRDKQLDIEGFSAINVWRTTLNEILDEHFEMIPYQKDPYQVTVEESEEIKT